MTMTTTTGNQLANLAGRGNLKALRDLLLELVATSIAFVDNLTAGTVTASQAVIVDSSKNIGTFGTVTASSFVGNLTGYLAGIPATALSTASTAPNTGISTIATTKGTSAKTFQIAAPALGVPKALMQTGNSTSIQKVSLPAGCTFDGTNKIAKFDTLAKALNLVGLSSTRYLILSNVGTVALSTS